MNRNKTPQRAARTKATSRGSQIAQARVASIPGIPAPQHETLRQRKYRRLVARHFDNLLDRLFTELTGVHFHVCWSPSPAQVWPPQTLPTGCSICCHLSGSPLRPACRICGPRQLARTLRAEGNGVRFTCRLGVRNYWLAVRLRDEVLGVAYLQALHRVAGGRGKPKRSADTDAVVMGAAEFDRAARFLQLIVEHVQTASLSDLRKADLTSAGHAVVALEKEQARLHEALKLHLPQTPQPAHHSRPESHADQIVHRLLECIAADFGRPITLRQCASKLGMNAAYLSDLFSHAVGVPFKTYLTELRLAKARELLNDPRQTASEVATAVGYSSENRFRIAFKKATGLSPKLWRETMQTNPPPLPPK